LKESKKVTKNERKNARKKEKERNEGDRTTNNAPVNKHAS
jgi:hypothetical protein